MSTLKEEFDGWPESFKTLPERIMAGQVTKAGVAAEITDVVYAGMKRFCAIPDAFHHCQLATTTEEVEGLSDERIRALTENPSGKIINPDKVHLEAVVFFHMLLHGDDLVCQERNALEPSVGGYLYGNVGAGKTHLMAAYGLKVKEMLDSRLTAVQDGLRQLISQAFNKYAEREAGWRDAGDGVHRFDISEGGEMPEEKDPRTEFLQTMASFIERLRNFTYSPTDLLYMGFKELGELCRDTIRRGPALKAIEKARIVFIDDIHPQADAEQVKLVLHILERRHELGRYGTFLTTNLKTEELGGQDEMIAKRLHSRCSESLLTLDFSECEDWRTRVKSQRIRLIKEEIARRLPDSA